MQRRAAERVRTGHAYDAPSGFRFLSAHAPLTASRRAVRRRRPAPWATAHRADRWCTAGQRLGRGRAGAAAARHRGAARGGPRSPTSSTTARGHPASHRVRGQGRGRRAFRLGRRREPGRRRLTGRRRRARTPLHGQALPLRRAGLPGGPYGCGVVGGGGGGAPGRRPLGPGRPVPAGADPDRRLGGPLLGLYILPSVRERATPDSPVHPAGRVTVGLSARGPAAVDGRRGHAPAVGLRRHRRPAARAEARRPPTWYAPSARPGGARRREPPTPRAHRRSRGQLPHG